LARRENFVEKFSTALGFLSGVIAFFSGLIVTMTWWHFFGTLGFECGCLLFPANVELYDPSCNINCGSGGIQEWPPKNKWFLTIDIHFEYHKVHRHERIPDSHRDIFYDSYRMPDRLIHQLQMQGSGDQGIMIQLIVDYLWYDFHACSMISKSLIKLLGANQQEMVGTPGSPILSRRSSRIGALHGSRCVSLISLGEAFPRFSSSFSDLGFASTSASAFSSSLIGSVGLIFLDFALGSTKLILSNILERSFTSVEVLPHTTLLAVHKWETRFAT
jgi:hypothetical protein